MTHAMTHAASNAVCTRHLVQPRTPFRSRLLALAFGALTSSALSLSAHAVESGQSAPEFSLPGAKGNVTLADYKGKTVYLDFWASWCGPCKQSFPWMNEMQARYAAKGLRIVAINVDQKPAEAASFLASNPAQFDVIYDAAGKTPRQYAIKGMPTSVLIGPDGKVLRVHSGFKDEERAELEQHIKQALNVKD
jgi:cytochrome c biogenesis protein CcmG, thiol:disulfide interchange protein DsbE